MSDSDTPRTDAMQKMWALEDAPVWPFVRALEKDLAAMTRERDEWKQKCYNAHTGVGDLRAEVERLRAQQKALIEAGDKMRHYQRVSNSYPQPSGEAWDRAVKEVRGE